MTKSGKFSIRIQTEMPIDKIRTSPNVHGTFVRTKSIYESSLNAQRGKHLKKDFIVGVLGPVTTIPLESALFT